MVLRGLQKSHVEGCHETTQPSLKQKVNLQDEIEISGFSAGRVGRRPFCGLRPVLMVVLTIQRASGGIWKKLTETGYALF
jgi:hypothetical protein